MSNFFQYLYFSLFLLIFFVGGVDEAGGSIIDNQTLENWSNEESNSIGTGNIGFSFGITEFGDAMSTSLFVSQYKKNYSTI